MKRKRRPKKNLGMNLSEVSAKEEKAEKKDMDAAEKLSTLLNIYGNMQEEIRFRQKRGDDAVYPAYTLLVATLGIQSLNEIIDVHLITLLLAVAIPIIAFTGIQRGNQEHKFVASARGYSSFLESQINRLLQENIALWNSAYIQRYIASMKVQKKKNLKTSQLLTYIGSVAPILLSCILAAWGLFQVYTDKDKFFQSRPYLLIGTIILITIYMIVVSVLVIKECKSFTSNEEIRVQSALFPKELQFPFSLEQIKKI